MRKHETTHILALKREGVYDRLYRNGVEMKEKKNKLIEKNIAKPDDPQCTFRPNLEKKAERLRRLVQQDRGNKENGVSRSVSNTPKHHTKGDLPSARNSYAIRKQINNLEVRGLESSYLAEARDAAVRRSKEFNDRFAKIEKLVYERRQSMTPRARPTNKFFLEEVQSEFLPPVKQQEPSRICKTPKGPRKDLEILIHEINDTKSTKSQSTKPKTPKPPKKMPVQENLSMTLQQCIHKAMLLSQTLDLQLSQRHK